MPHNQDPQPLYVTQLETPIGAMIAVSDDQSLHLLHFVGEQSWPTTLQKTQTKLKKPLREHFSDVHQKLSFELAEYFAGQRQIFSLALVIPGTTFQKKVWDALQTIPFGQTISYKQLAQKIDLPTGFRAAANANGKNFFSVIIPCHRVINTNGKLGGYTGGIMFKEKLLNHENNHKI